MAKKVSKKVTKTVETKNRRIQKAVDMLANSTKLLHRLMMGLGYSDMTVRGIKAAYTKGQYNCKSLRTMKDSRKRTLIDMIKNQDIVLNALICKATKLTTMEVAAIKANFSRGRYS